FLRADDVRGINAVRSIAACSRITRTGYLIGETLHELASSLISAADGENLDAFFALACLSFVSRPPAGYGVACALGLLMHRCPPPSALLVSLERLLALTHHRRQGIAGNAV